MAEHHSQCLGKYTPQIALFSRNRALPSVRTVQIGEGALRNDVTDPMVYLCRRSYTSSASVSGSRGSAVANRDRWAAWGEKLWRIRSDSYRREAASGNRS